MTTLLGRRLPGLLAARAAAARGRSLALVYHRVRPEPARDNEVVPCVRVELFRAQVQALLGLGDVVPLAQLVPSGRSDRSGRPRFALSFDDDYRTHVDYVLPVLRELAVPATFFLSGRSLHALGPYWWEVLEARLRVDGAGRVARALDVATAEPAAIARACEEDPERRHLLEASAGAATDQLAPAAIGALADAGMTVGFHTVAHEALPLLDAAGQHRALTIGRDRLEAATGQRLDLLAYPHGRADAGAAGRARAAGFRAAWTGADTAVTRRSDRWLLGRWEPGPADTHEVRARALVRLLRRVPDRG